MAATTILLYGDSGDGKTAQVGALAEYVYLTLGKKKTRLYCADPGGWATIQPYVSLGIVEPIDCTGFPAWEMLDAITKGKVRRDGKWVVDVPEDLGAVAYEGYTGLADVLMQSLAKDASQNKNIGGQAPAVKFTQGDASFASNSPAHYGIVQTQLTVCSQESFRLPVDYVVWTATARRAADNDTTATILGPQIVGKALTSEVPRWFNYTFRLMAIPPDELTKRPGSHRLYFSDHTDMTLQGAKGLGNDRLPLDAEALPPYIEPASVVKALESIRAGSLSAEGKIRARLGL